MKLSVSSANCYLLCQRKYWHKKVKETAPDDDYKVPSYFNFGRAYADIQEIISKEPSDLNISLVVDICLRNKVSTTDAARMLRMLVEYQRSKSPDEVVTQCEYVIDHPVVSGRIDKLININGEVWIGEDKTASQLNYALSETLKTDPQICGYAACRDSIEDAFGLEVAGVLYRVAKKPIEKRKKEESWQDYFSRCKSEIQTIMLPFSSLEIGPVLARQENIIEEISKKSEYEDFIQNMRSCDAGFSYCEYYSQCHGNNATYIKGLQDVKALSNCLQQ